jgi:hypothetical protein
MQTVTRPEQAAVAKRQNDKPQVSSEPSFARVELQVDPAWLAELDACADALGLSRSAYIRMACNRQMTADRRLQGPPLGSPED